MCGCRYFHCGLRSAVLSPYAIFVGLASTIYIRCTYGIFGREITEDTVIYGAYIWFWPTLNIWCAALPMEQLWLRF